MSPRFMATVLGWLVALLILRVLVSIVANYPDYFPPNFDALFLHGRESTFHGAYRAAFYVHIFSGPVVLLTGLVLMNESLLRRYRLLHRVLGRVHLAALLLLMLPTSVVMAGQAFGGTPAGLSFLLLTGVTAACAVVGLVHALRHRYASHRRWMQRCFVLICSAVVLRLMSGAAGLLGATDPETAYVVAAWASWLVPLAAYEVVFRWPKAV